MNWVSVNNRYSSLSLRIMELISMQCVQTPLIFTAIMIVSNSGVFSKRFNFNLHGYYNWNIELKFINWFHLMESFISIVSDLCVSLYSQIVLNKPNRTTWDNLYCQWSCRDVESMNLLFSVLIWSPLSPREIHPIRIPVQSSPRLSWKCT